MFSLLISAGFSARWAVLLAGSRGYNNYRHQADVFHIYSILTSRGFDKKHIITIAFDDIVDHEMNPFKGKIFSTADHHNVYPGSDSIDYKGTNATAENFLRVLLGDTRYGRALETTKDDDIFIYYNDHGAPGLLCVPSNNGPELYADQLSQTINTMYEQKRYNNIFFVIEACYSGSVGYNISSPGVFVTVAAGPQQSSYSADWDSSLQTFRTNEFTKHFTNYLLSNPASKIIDFVNRVAIETTRSHVCAFGDFSVAQRRLSDFLMEAKPIIIYSQSEENSKESENSIPLSPNGAFDLRAKNSFVTFLQRRLLVASGEERNKLQNALDYEISRRKTASHTFKRIARQFESNGDTYSDLDPSKIKYDCYRTAVEGFRMFCGEVDEHELPKLRIFGHICSNVSTEELLSQIRDSCPQKLWKNEDLYV